MLRTNRYAALLRLVEQSNIIPVSTAKGQNLHIWSCSKLTKEGLIAGSECMQGAGRAPISILSVNFRFFPASLSHLPGTPYIRPSFLAPVLVSYPLYGRGYFHGNLVAAPMRCRETCSFFGDHL